MPDPSGHEPSAMHSPSETKVVFDFPGGSEGWQEHAWMVAVPSEGDAVERPDGSTYMVRTVVWYPWGSEDAADPFVYVVLRRP